MPVFPAFETTLASGKFYLSKRLKPLSISLTSRYHFSLFQARVNQCATLPD